MVRSTLSQNRVPVEGQINLAGGMMSIWARKGPGWGALGGHRSRAWRGIGQLQQLAPGDGAVQPNHWIISWLNCSIQANPYDRAIARSQLVHNTANSNLGKELQRGQRERERELRKEGREVPSRVRLREGPIGVRITLGQPTIG